MTNSAESRPYGSGDASFQAAGGEAGIRALVDDFYDIMASDPRFQRILGWHPQDLEVSRDKLARFLCGWLGGPRRYREKYGPITIPGVHQHLPVTAVEEGMWLDCMALAVARQPWPEAFKDYLLTQLAVPAGRIRTLCGRTHPALTGGSRECPADDPA